MRTRAVHSIWLFTLWPRRPKNCVFLICTFSKERVKVRFFVKIFAYIKKK